MGMMEMQGPGSHDAARKETAQQLLDKFGNHVKSQTRSMQKAAREDHSLAQFNQNLPHLSVAADSAMQFITQQFLDGPAALHPLELVADWMLQFVMVSLRTEADEVKQLIRQHLSTWQAGYASLTEEEGRGMLGKALPELLQQQIVIYTKAADLHRQLPSLKAASSRSYTSHVTAQQGGQMQCKFWNGRQGSCRAGPECKYSASHTPGRATALHETWEKERDRRSRAGQDRRR